MIVYTLITNNYNLSQYVFDALIQYRKLKLHFSFIIIQKCKHNVMYYLIQSTKINVFAHNIMVRLFSSQIIEVNKKIKMIDSI